MLYSIRETIHATLFSSKSPTVPLIEPEPSIINTMIDLLNVRAFNPKSLREMFKKDGFGIPSGAMDERILTNLNYYGTNYIILAVFMFLYVCSVAPFFLFTSVSVVTINYTQGYNSHILAVSLLGLLITGGSTLFFALIIGLGMIALHASLRRDLKIE
jgi:hypothetical protein